MRPSLVMLPISFIPTTNLTGDHFMLLVEQRKQADSPIGELAAGYCRFRSDSAFVACTSICPVASFCLRESAPSPRAIDPVPRSEHLSSLSSSPSAAIRLQSIKACHRSRYGRPVSQRSLEPARLVRSQFRAPRLTKIVNG